MSKCTRIVATTLILAMATVVLMSPRPATAAWGRFIHVDEQVIARALSE